MFEQHPVSDLLRDVTRNVDAALAEDVGDLDLSADVIGAQSQLSASVITREDGVLCGRPWVDAVFDRVSPGLVPQWRHADGDEIAAGTELFRVDGAARELLTAERSALNFLQLLSGTATATRALARLIEDLPTRLLDTRKTVPGLRLAQKYAVRCGGGSNHRLGLWDAYLLKENHIAAAGSIGDAVRAARQRPSRPAVEIEVETLEELDEAIAAGADVVMLDEFSLEDTREAVRRTRQRTSGATRLEASGSIDARSLRAVAETGVDYISVGSITKHVRALDLSMRFI